MLSFRESVALDPVLYDCSVRLLAALRWTGLAMVEFKVGPRGPILMEVNGRVWGSLPLAVMSGVDFPRLLAELYLLGPPTNGAAPQLRYRLNVRARNLALDLVWIASALSGRRGYAFLEVPGPREGIGGEPGRMNNPWAICLDSKGNLYVADSGNHRVEKFVRRKTVAQEAKGGGA